MSSSVMLIKKVGEEQCDQMAKLSFRFRAINNNENLSNVIKICPIMFKKIPNAK